MKFFLMRMNICGIKGIEKEIELNFCNSTISNEFSPIGTNVKAIYGTNGVGKSSIINAVEIYKSIVIDPNFISKNQTYLSNIINKKLKKFYIEMTYRIMGIENEKDILQSHYIEIAEKDGEFVITNEKLFKIIGNSINRNKKLLIESKDGSFIFLNLKNDELNKKIYDKNTNLLNKKSFIDNFFINNLHINDLEVESNSNDINKINDIKYMLSTLYHYLFCINILTYVENTDKHKSFDRGYIEKIQNFISNDSNFSISKLLFEDDKILITESSKYEKNLIKEEKFIKIFKPTIKSLSYDKKINDKYYHYNKILNYDGYSIDLEFESTGVKKLIKMFKYFNLVSNGYIVFIDELDANLHDVYLSKLLEYVGNYASGQLIFTSHNTGPMNEIQNFKNSINFLTVDNEIIEWNKNGTYKAQDQYKKGMIKNNPFNINDFEFYEVFEGEECS